MSNIIDIKNLYKSYQDSDAVRGINLYIKEGEMFGLVGPDGAGKTTTIRILCGLLGFDDGNIEVFGLNLAKNISKIQKEIGYLSQKYSLYGDLSVDENIEFFAQIHGISNYHSMAENLLEMMRLIKFRDRLADNLSGGMKQKLALACALIHKPKILFLDEPTTGVDPVSRREFWKILSNLQREGLSILMTTPYLDEAERCNRVALMNEGKILICDTVNNIKHSINKILLELVCNPSRKAYSLLKHGYEVQMFGDRLNVIINDTTNDLAKIKQLLGNNNVILENYREITPSLENVFIHMIENK